MKHFIAYVKKANNISHILKFLLNFKLDHKVSIF